MRVTRKMCETQVELLNRALGRPTAAWRSTVNGRPRTWRPHASLTAQIGNFHIHSNSPGDGLTRYQLGEMRNEHGGISIVDNRTCLGASEFYTFLRGILAGVDLGHAHNPKERNK